jgi:hypothetical protein
VAKAEENLIIRSQEFDVAAGWSANGISITTNSTTAPDGTSTASTLSESATTSQHFNGSASSSFPNSTVYTQSVYAKAGTVSVLQLVFASGPWGVNAYANYDLSSGVLGTVGSSATATITSVGSGWYRCTLTATTTAAANGAGVILTLCNNSTTAARVPSYAGNTASNIYIWGAQLEQRSSVTAYTATTTAPITNYIPALQTAASGVARFEHNPTTGESLGLEIEEQRTNLVLQSQFASGYTPVRLTVNSNVAIAPDGTQTASKAISTTVSGTHAIYRGVSVTSGTAYTWSGYFKAGEYNTIQLNCQATASIYVVKFDLTNGTTTNVSGTGSATITAVGNGWYRCTATATATGTGTGFWQVDIYDNSGNTSYAGNDWNGVYIWGAQLEAGAFATSYIPTVASQVTRSADSASMTGTNFSSWYRADEGTFYAEAMPANTGETRYVASINTGSTAGFIALANDRSALKSGGTDQAVFSFTRTSAMFKNIIGYKVNDTAGSNNGSTPSTDTSCITDASVNQLAIGDLEPGTNRRANGTIRKIAYYAKRLTNAELQSLTTI